MLEPGISRNLTLYPMLTSRIPGYYHLIVSAVSVQNPQVINTANVNYSYSLDSKLTCMHLDQPVTIGQPVQFNVTLNTDRPGPLGLRVGGVENGWNAT